MLSFRQVLIIASTTFQRVSSKPIPRLLVFTFGIRMRIVQISSVVISLY